MSAVRKGIRKEKQDHEEEGMPPSVGTALTGDDIIDRALIRIGGVTAFHDWQKRVLSEFDRPRPSEEIKVAANNNGNLLITTKTGGGKSLLANVLAMKTLLRRPGPGETDGGPLPRSSEVGVDGGRRRNVLFLFPLVALAGEKFAELCSYGVECGFLVEEYAGGKGRIPPTIRRKGATGDVKSVAYVATIEKGYTIVKSLVSENRTNELGLVIVDEIQFLGIPGRGAILEKTIALLGNDGTDSPRIIGLTATLGNPTDIARYLQAKHMDFQERVVPHKEYVVTGPQGSVFRHVAAGKDGSSSSNAAAEGRDESSGKITTLENGNTGRTDNIRKNHHRQQTTPTSFRFERNLLPLRRDPSGGGGDGGNSSGNSSSSSSTDPIALEQIQIYALIREVMISAESRFGEKEERGGGVLVFCPNKAVTKNLAKRLAELRKAEGKKWEAEVRKLEWTRNFEKTNTKTANESRVRPGGSDPAADRRLGIHRPLVGEALRKEREKLVRGLDEERGGEGTTDEDEREFLLSGFAYHHGSLGSGERRLIEDAFRIGVIGAVCCTTTLAAGVNLPVSRVIVRNLGNHAAAGEFVVPVPTSSRSKTQYLSETDLTGSLSSSSALAANPPSAAGWITKGSYLQMIGRAGRLGTKNGDSFVILDSGGGGGDGRGNQLNVAAEFLDVTPVQPVRSQMTRDDLKGFVLDVIVAAGKHHEDAEGPVAAGISSRLGTPPSLSEKEIRRRLNGTLHLFEKRGAWQQEEEHAAGTPGETVPAENAEKIHRDRRFIEELLSEMTTEEMVVLRRPQRERRLHGVQYAPTSRTSTTENTETAVYYEATQMGIATSVAGFDFDTGKKLEKLLSEAAETLHLKTFFHLIVACTPVDTERLFGNTPGTRVEPKFVAEQIWSLETADDDDDDDGGRRRAVNDGLVAKEQGYNPARVMSMYGGNHPPGPKNFRRFAAALVVYKCYLERDANKVAALFGLDRATVQNVLVSFAAFSRGVIKFCDALGSRFWQFKALLTEAAPQFWNCSNPDLAPLLTLPTVQDIRAKQLHRAGYGDLTKIARADPKDMASRVPHLTYKTAAEIIGSAKMYILEKWDTAECRAKEAMEAAQSCLNPKVISCSATTTTTTGSSSITSTTATISSTAGPEAQIKSPKKANRTASEIPSPLPSSFVKRQKIHHVEDGASGKK